MKLRSTLVALAMAAVALSLASVAVGEPKSGGEVRSSAEVANEKPGNVRFLGLGDADPDTPGEQVAPRAGHVARLAPRFQAEDGNGWRDLREGSFEVFRPDGSRLVGPLPLSTTGQGNGKRGELAGAFELAPEEPAGLYRLRATIVDRMGDVTDGEGTFEHQAMLALSIDARVVAFGAALTPGATTHAAPAAVAVRNVGNVAIDLHVSATPLSSSEASIPADRLRYSARSDMGDERALSETGVTDTTFDLLPGLAKDAYFDVHVPTGDEQYVPAATYTGSITLGAVVG